MAIPGSIVGVGKLVTPGGAQGPIGPTAVSSDPGNIATLGTDGLVLVPQSTIWNQRLRSYNSLGNPNFEVDQRLCGVANTGNGIQIDRWIVGGAGTWTTTKQQVTIAGGPLAVPGTSFGITNKMLRVILTGQQASLGATDVLQIVQNVEGPQFRELVKDVHSLSLFVASSVSNLKFSVALISPDNTSSIVYLCTLGATGGYTLIQLPNIPVWSGGNFSMNPGVQGYVLKIGLAVGATYIAPATGSFQNGQFIGAPGMSNFAAAPVGSAFDIAFVQHEPGPLCTTLQDKPFSQNLDECMRMYQKSYSYAVKYGAIDSNGSLQWFQPNAATAANVLSVRFPKIMAKIPTMTAYSPVTGVVGAVADMGVPTDRGVSSFNGVGDSGFGGFVLASAPPANSQMRANYTADTGW